MLLHKTFFQCIVATNLQNPILWYKKHKVAAMAQSNWELVDDGANGGAAPETQSTLGNTRAQFCTNRNHAQH